MSLEKIAKEVKGSLNSISSLYLLLASVVDFTKKNKNSDTASFNSSLHSLRDVFSCEGLTEPTIKNILDYVIGKGDANTISPSSVLGRVDTIKKYIKTSQKKISIFSYSKLVDGGTVFVFGYDTFITRALKYTRSGGKIFKVNNTEMRPGLQGRKLAGELSKGGINVTHYTDASLKNAMKGADVVFSNCKAILTCGKIIGAIGFELVVDTAHNLGIPIYVCAPSWKIDTRIASSNDSEIYSRKIWDKAPKGVDVRSNCFDIVDSKVITGIISELGIYSTQAFIEETRYENMWWF